MWAFAFGTRTGVRMTLTPSLARSASNAAGNLCVAVVDEEPRRLVASVEFHKEVARLLQHPGGVGLACDREVLDAAVADRDEGEHVEAAQPDGVDGEEVAGEDRLAMCAQEAAPRLRVAPRRRRHARPNEDVTDRTRRDRDAQLAQLARDSQVAQLELSRASRRISSRTSRLIGGRPGRRCG
jgi:hypothetical protein